MQAHTDAMPAERSQAEERALEHVEELGERPVVARVHAGVREAACATTPGRCEEAAQREVADPRIVEDEVRVERIAAAQAGQRDGDREGGNRERGEAARSRVVHA